MREYKRTFPHTSTPSYSLLLPHIRSCSFIFPQFPSYSFEKEDYGQTLGKWGSSPGCYFVLPVLGPTTARDAIGLVGNTFLDPVYHVTHNTETDMLIGNQNYQEHNYYIFT